MGYPRPTYANPLIGIARAAVRKPLTGQLSGREPQTCESSTGRQGDLGLGRNKSEQQFDGLASHGRGHTATLPHCHTATMPQCHNALGRLNGGLLLNGLISVVTYNVPSTCTPYRKPSVASSSWLFKMLKPHKIVAIIIFTIIIINARKQAQYLIKNTRSANHISDHGRFAACYY